MRLRWAKKNLMMRSPIGHLVIAALAVTVAAASGKGVYAQADKRVSVHDSRPLAEAHLELVKQTRSLVTFEDAYYEYKGDLFDFSLESGRSVQLNRDGSPTVIDALFSAQMWFAPRRTLVFDYPAAELANPDVLFAKLVSNYHLRFFENEFRLVREGQWLHILPKAGKNQKGELIERASRLDVRVTFPEAERTVEATVKLLVESIKKTTVTNLLFGVGAESLFERTKVRIGAQNEVARHVLMRVLASTGYKVTWSVLCTFDSTPDRRTDISDGACGLNFRVLE